MKNSSPPRLRAFLRLHPHRLTLAIALCVAPVCALSQAVPANWTDDMPSVAKVEQQIQGTDPTDTLERQVAVFEYLQTYVQRIKETRDYKGPYLPAEAKLRTDYGQAQYDLQQSYNKTHTQQEIGAFSMKEGQYSENNALDWIKQLQGNQAAVAYTNTEADLAASQQRVNAGIQADLNGQYQPPGAGTGNSAGSLSAGQKRCLELGDTYATCAGPGGMVGAVANLYTSIVSSGVPGANSPPPPPPLNGVVLVGLYHSRTDLPQIALWDSGSAILSNCGTLADNTTNYTIRKAGGTTQIVLPTEPNPIVLSLQPDGSLAGPGTVQVKGNIIIGTNSSYHCIGGNCTTTSNNVLQAKMDSCKLSLLAPQPLPTPTGPAYDQNAIKITYAAPPANGFWIAGDYASSDGMLLSFANKVVTVDCGQAHIKSPYTVSNTGSGFVVQVQANGSPFQLAVAPDNTLRGSGSATINGRLVNTVVGQNVSFTAVSQTCSLASFAPKGTQNTMVASNAQTPAIPAYAAPAATQAPAANAPLAAAPSAGVPISAAPVSSLQIAVATSFPAGSNPLAGHVVFLMSDRFDTALRASGGQIAASTTPGKALQAYAANCVAPKSCPSVTPTLNKYYVATAKFDNNGSATMNASLPPGTYYVFTSGNTTGGILVWDIPTQLSAGPGNSITLASNNAEVLN